MGKALDDMRIPGFNIFISSTKPKELTYKQQREKDKELKEIAYRLCKKLKIKKIKFKE